MSEPTAAVLNEILLASPRWPHGELKSVSLTEVGHGFGFGGGTVYRASAHVQSGARAAAGAVTFIVKREAADPTRRATLFHETIGNRLGRVVPACYGATVIGEEGLLVLEDIRGRQGDVLADCPDDELAALTRSVVAVHVASWQTDAASHPTDLPRWQAGGWEDERWADRLTRARNRYPEVVTSAIVERLADLPSQVNAAVAELRTGPAAWIQTDAHRDNVIWRDDGSAVLLDWSGAAIGPPGVDLAPLCLEGPLGGQRIAEQSRLVASIAAAELAGRGITGIDEAVVSRWIGLGMQPLLQGIVGSAGRPDETITDSRMVALRDNAIRNVVGWLETEGSRQKPRI